MDIREQSQAGESQLRHPWERSRFEFFRGVLDQHGLLSSNSVLDVGSGDAWFASRLAESLAQTAHVVCWDSGYDDPASVPGTAADSRIRTTDSQPDGAFSLIMLMDVLEHVDDDIGFLSSIAQHNLEPGGRVLVSVPAWQGLMSSHDQFLGHHRRYSPATLAALLGDAGLDPVARGGLFHSLLVPRALTVARERALSGDEPAASQLSWNRGKAVTSLVLGALRADNWVSRASAKLGIRLPGLSTWALCRAAS